MLMRDGRASAPVLRGYRWGMPEIRYIEGDATAPDTDDNAIIVHVCNDVGGWGRGFVVALSKRWPEPEARYRAWHRGEEREPFELGAVQLVQVEDHRWVANLIGQRGTRPSEGTPPVRYDAIRAGLARVRDHALALQASVFMPRIGCGLAGGTWEHIEPLIEDELTTHGISVTVVDLPSS